MDSLGNHSDSSSDHSQGTSSWSTKKTKKLGPLRLRLVTMPTCPMPERNWEKRPSGSRFPDSHPRSRPASFKLSSNCGPSLDLAATLSTMSQKRQTKFGSKQNGKSMQTIINLVYKYRARSISELYDKCSADEFSDVLWASKDYIKETNCVLELFVKDNLELQRRNRWEYFLSFQKYCAVEEAELIKIFAYQNIDIVYFANCLKDILMCTDPKINCLKLYGCPNSCKSLIAQLICSLFICCYCNNHGSENEFYFSNFLNKSIVLCEELYVTQATCEDFKQILGGAPIDVDKKFHCKQVLTRTPIIVTSNFMKYGRGHLSNIDENALSLRSHVFEFNSEYKPECIISAPSLAHLMYLAVNQDIL